MQTSIHYGLTRSGKTRFLATFPRPAIITSKREAGAVTIDCMDRNCWYEPEIEPEVYEVSSVPETMQHLTRDIMPKVQRGLIKTIGIELGIYSDDVIKSAPIVDGNAWAKYALLEAHIIDHLDKWIKTATMGVRLAYNALAKPPDKIGDTGGLDVPGKAVAKKLPPLCEVIGYMHAEAGEKETEYVIHYSPCGPYIAGHRYGDRLPRFVKNVTFRDIENLLLGRAEASEDGTIVSKSPAQLTALTGGKLPPLGFKK
jgi:hypothetical protein